MFYVKMALTHKLKVSQSKAGLSLVGMLCPGLPEAGSAL